MFSAVASKALARSSVVQRSSNVLRLSRRFMGGHAADHEAEMIKWKKMSQGMAGAIGVVTVLTVIQHSMHHHDEHEDETPPPPYMKIRSKPYPWQCTDCDFFDSKCHAECKEKLAALKSGGGH
mmetsp:Transcript_6472/g.8772  ORF Transcript_6472/g.8772 Transcript_6472/m.8772 type:complete len:123 (+) Transcript_6472:86-454(+)